MEKPSKEMNTLSLNIFKSRQDAFLKDLLFLNMRPVLVKQILLALVLSEILCPING